MRRIEPVLANDHAQVWLAEYLQGTEQLLRRAVGDSHADDVEIRVASDLCIPFDVTRLAGGFATGMYVRWNAATPFVPVDISMNTDVTSVFYIEGKNEEFFSEQRLADLRAWVEKRTMYLWNFHRGNHFISLVRSHTTGRHALILHSNEKEFKLQANGLIPTPDNWFYDAIETVNDGDRSLRVLRGEKATRFYELAHWLESFSIHRHRVIASRLLAGDTSIIEEQHALHYFMPSPREAVLGSYLCRPGEIVPILSHPGGPIFLFQCVDGGQNKVMRPDGSRALLVGHGYGKTSRMSVSLTVEGETMRLNDIPYTIAPNVNTSSHSDFQIRTFADDPDDPASFFSATRHHTPGKVVDVLDQRAWYCGGSCSWSA